MFSKISLSAIRRYLITLLVVLAALFIGWRLWIHYENDPWTRDGRIKADVVQVATEVTEQGQSRVEEARAALLQAIVDRDKAQLDLDRTQVVAAVDGIVTNLDLRTGSYVTASHPVMALVDRNSYYAEGYFEETKLPNIAEGNRATIKLMSDDEVLEGHVHSISRGIEDRERTKGGRLLQNINPAFNWVRLVQRIPVRVEFDNIPENVRLVAGQTVTIEVFPSENVTVAKNDQSAK